MPSQQRPGGRCAACNKEDWRIRRGLCNACYEADRRARGLVVRPARPPRPPRPVRTCDVEGCERKHRGRGRCMRHLAELRRREAGVPARRQHPRECKRKDCDQRYYARGLCLKHYRQFWRLQRGGRPRPLPPAPRKKVPRGHWHTEERDDRKVDVIHWPPRELTEPWLCPTCDFKVMPS